MRLRVFYAALSYESIVETEAYPLEEMVNELVGIIGLYFGYSVTSVAPLCYLVVQKLYLSNSQSNSINLETKNKYFVLEISFRSGVLRGGVIVLGDEKNESSKTNAVNFGVSR